MSRMIMNLKIGTKLAIASVLSILLVGGMIYTQMHGNAGVRVANESVIRLQTVLHDMMDSKASARGMQIGVRDVRLAASPDALQKAGDYLSARKNLQIALPRTCRNCRAIPNSFSASKSTGR